MRVKVAELKTHLPKYLRQIDKDGQAIEVCVREDAVAYLTSARAHDSTEQAKKQLAQQLKAVGIQVSQWGSRAPTALGPKEIARSLPMGQIAWKVCAGSGAGDARLP